MDTVGLSLHFVRWLLSLSVLTGLLWACSAHQVDLGVQAPATSSLEPGGYEQGVVTSVIDGDTIEVQVMERVEGPGIGDAQVGDTYDVRLTGIDTPESVKPGWPVECFGKEASAAARALLQGEQVKLVKDVEEADRYERLLRYVYLGDEMVDARLVANGYAQAYTHPPNVRHSALLASLQRAARRDDRGLWSPDTCDGRSE